MNTIRKAGSLVLGAALLASCTERSTPTASSDARAIAFSTAGQTTAVDDPTGDMKSKYPAYLDIVRAATTRKDRSFIFALDLAAPVPNDPAPDFPSGPDFLNVALFGLDTDPTAVLVGYPFKDHTANPFEFFIAASWNPTGSWGLGTGFVGLFVDRRPLLTGGQAVVRSVPFTIEGSRVTLVVDAALLGDPATFQWGAATVVSNHAAPTDEFTVPDFAPDNGLPLVSWPQ
jgi:hypothetical protein